MNFLDGLAIDSERGASWLALIRILLVLVTLISSPAVLAILHSLVVLACICPTMRESRHKSTSSGFCMRVY